MVVPGYEVAQEIARNDWQSLFRGNRSADGQPVLLKISNRGAGAEMLEHEFELLRELTIAGVPRVLELLPLDDGNRCLALEDRGGVMLRSVPGLCLPSLDTFFALAIQLATTLAELHRREIVLQSLNPDNILFNAETGEVCLADFSFATRTAGETRTPHRLLRHALVYLSPEQTGRMNRAVDYRTDFYSLGVTFYELLAGHPPFQSADPLELIHQHIAKTPPAPAAVFSEPSGPEIPEPLSRIVMKLLAKTAEGRYQSALGLKADLERCAREWAAHRRIAPFPLGEHDISDRFNIPQALYGREREAEKLIAAFDRVCAGLSVMMLVAGYSGIGKTSLIQELYKPIVRERGYFISGKFDQVVRGVPFGALIQAMRGLVRQLLTESEERLDAWRARLTEALGANGGVLAEVIPEIELIIGKQPAPVALGPAESLNRFQLVFQNFVGALARKEHPLVIFLDDLQWADSATLSLLGPLLTSPSVRHLFLMGAYRDNEVDAAHPLTRSLRALESAGVELHRVRLGPLDPPDLARFIRDTLHCELGEAEPLARLVWEKTGGNPFFVIQFLRTLQQESFLKFDYERCQWVYDIEAIAGAGVTDNVIDLMTRKIQRSSFKTQRALTLAACIGDPFYQQTLALVSEQSPEAVAEDLKEAIHEGLILPAEGGAWSVEGRGKSEEGGARREEGRVKSEEGRGKSEDAPRSSPLAPRSYAFLHDRVQQAAYALIPMEWKQIVHLSVGRLLRERADEAQSDEKLFDIVQHLNLGSSLIADEAERLALVRLNLSAGRKAKSSTAYEAALDYFQAGVGLLSPGDWDSDYDLAFALHLEAAECQYLCGNFDEVERQFDVLLERARTRLDKARVYNLRMRQYENMSRYADALAVARENLALFGVSLPDSADEKSAALEREIETIQSLLGERSIESLVDLPVMTDPETRMVMNILTNIWASTYITGDAVLARLLSATMVRFSLTSGNVEESAYGYVTHAITVGPVRGDYAAAYEFGRLALAVNERFNDPRLRAKIHQQFHAHVALWRKPMETCIAHAREACRSGLENGDFLYAAYGAYTETWPAQVSTQDLDRFVRDYTPSLALIRKLKNASFGDAHQLALNWARALGGKTHAPFSLSDEAFDENQYVETYRGNPFFTMFHAAARMQLDYFAGETDRALESAEVVRGLVHQLSGTIWTAIFDFWNGLVLAAKYADATEAEQRNYLEEMKRSRDSLSVLAENCPENYRCQSLLLAAEVERVTGQELSALELYERAIRYAEEAGAIQHRALANELCGRFWFGRGQQKIAAVFLTEAHRCYARWGAAAKVAELERRYADLRVRSPRVSEGLMDAGPATDTEDALDLFSVMKAAQAIASEMDLEKLLAKLMGIAIENAGAVRGHLILKHGDKLFVRAEGSLDAAGVKVHDAIPLDQSQSLPLSIVNYVGHTLESVVLAEAKDDDRFGNDPFVLRQRPRSVICVPVVSHGELIGALYLENNIAGGVFTEGRIEVMHVLASQAAISLENARLYTEMTTAENRLRSIMEGTAAVTGDDFFASLVRHLASALEVRYAFVTECRERPPIKARTLAFWKGECLADKVSYEIAETPCLKVLDGERCYYPTGVQRLFPNDKDLVDMNAEGYLGIPLRNAGGEVIGHLAVLDDKPVVETPQSRSLLNIFAARAGAELERLHAEEELRQAMAEVQRLKNQLHAENIYLQEEIRREHNFDEVVGRSPALLDLLGQVERVAPTDATVLILGETGTGKELIARAIHDRSGRRNRPLVKVNCGSIPAGLVESELFGHVKGAFTGALDKRTGRFELADGGTLFLDEVGELPLETQVKLLRVLQEGEFEPVGGSKTIKVDVRIIAATNRNLEDEVKAGRFRADLFYRLNVVPLHNPPLRHRREDIPQLAAFFLSRYSRQFGKQMDGIAQETIERLVQYDWPGNIRELENLIERGVVLSRGSVLTIDRNLLPTTQQAWPEAQPRVIAQAASQPAAPPSFASSLPPAGSTSLEELQRQHILNTLAQTDWVIEGDNGAAKLLRLHPNTLRSRLKKMGIQRPKA